MRKGEVSRKREQPASYGDVEQEEEDEEEY